MQSQELDLELLTYGERNSRLISTIRNELNELNAFNSSTGGYGSDNGVRGKVPPAINKRQSGKDTKGKKKVAIKAPAAGEGEDRQGSNPDEVSEERCNWKKGLQTLTPLSRAGGGDKGRQGKRLEPQIREVKIYTSGKACQ